MEDIETPLQFHRYPGPKDPLVDELLAAMWSGKPMPTIKWFWQQQPDPTSVGAACIALARFCNIVPGIPDVNLFLSNLTDLGKTQLLDPGVKIELYALLQRRDAVDACLNESRLYGEEYGQNPALAVSQIRAAASVGRVDDARSILDGVRSYLPAPLRELIEGLIMTGETRDSNLIRTIHFGEQQEPEAILIVTRAALNLGDRQCLRHCSKALRTLPNVYLGKFRFRNEIARFRRNPFGMAGANCLAIYWTLRLTVSHILFFDSLKAYSRGLPAKYGMSNEPKG